MKRLLPTGYITMGELHRRLGDRYTRQWLSHLAAKGIIPDAKPRPPGGKQWMFRDTPKLRAWIADTKRERETKVLRYVLMRKRNIDPRRESFVILAFKIERWFREQPPVDQWSDERRKNCKRWLAGVARIHAQL